MRRLDDTGVGHKASVVGPGGAPGDFKLRWAKPGEVPASAPKVGALVRLIRRAATGELRAVRAQVQALGADGLVIHATGAVSDYEKRGYDRVAVSFPMTYRKLTSAEATALRAEIAGGGAASAASGARRALGAAAKVRPESPDLRRLERKLDLIMAHLGITDPEAAVGSRSVTGGETAIGRRGATAVDLSGSGLRFRADEALEPGDQLDIKLDIPGAPQRVRALLEVVRKVDGTDVAGRFKAMGEAGRSAVVEHVFQLKRRPGAAPLRKAG